MRYPFILALGIIGAATSCSHPDYSAQIKTIDSLSVKLDSSMILYSKVDLEEIAEITDTAKSQLQYVQQNYVGPMRKDMASILSDYSNMIKLIPDAEEKEEEIKEEGEKAKEQLSSLKKALTDGSTHDANGKEFTLEYVQELVRSEREATQEIINEIALLSNRSRSITERNSILYPKVKFWVDSIPTNPKPKMPFGASGGFEENEEHERH